MTQIRIDRRSFIKSSMLAGGGMFLSFSWMASCKASTNKGVSENWFELNGYIKIGEDGAVTLASPNPEFGQNIKTSMPMILAEELDVAWEDVSVEQASFLPDRFKGQFTGGSQAIRQNWIPLRTAGATARQMLILAAATHWNVPATEITTHKGVLLHASSGRKAPYGEFASAAASVTVPQNVALKEVRQFNIIGTSHKNVDQRAIVTGQGLYGMDLKREGMLIAMIVHPPAFGMQLKQMDDTDARKMPGIHDIFTIEVLPTEYERGIFDTMAFLKLAVVTGRSTWEVLQAKKALKIEWEEEPERTFSFRGWDGKSTPVTYPAGLPDSREMQSKIIRPEKTTVLRKDGNPQAAFGSAAKIIERTYTAPFLAHNTMEPTNCFAHVTADKVEIEGPTQSPEFMAAALEKRLGIPKENIHIRLPRMGGGFGRRFYGHHILEAALISKHVQAPVKLTYTREDDMTGGIYRPAYSMTYRAALDAQNNLVGLHVTGGGIPESPIHENRFPAGAVAHYLAESWILPSNITVGYFRAPSSNFNASAEQSFLDEVAIAVGKDPIDFRLELLEKAKKTPVGTRNDYDADRYANVLRLVREKSGWGHLPAGISRGVSAYFCHNSYVAQVLDLKLVDGLPRIERVVAAVDCGIVVNPVSAINMVQGAIVDGIGNALFGEMNFRTGEPQKSNFNQYRMIRMPEAPRHIEVHFVENDLDPTGLGEPPFPPVFAALANALYQATGKRFYHHPYMNELAAQPIDQKDS